MCLYPSICIIQGRHIHIPLTFIVVISVHHYIYQSIHIKYKNSYTCTSVIHIIHTYMYHHIYPSIHTIHGLIAYTCIPVIYMNTIDIYLHFSHSYKSLHVCSRYVYIYIFHTITQTYIITYNNQCYHIHQTVISHSFSTICIMPFVYRLFIITVTVMILTRS